MKFKVKFRLTGKDGKSQKFSFNLEEGKPFIIGKALPGLTYSMGTLVMREGNLYVTSDRAKESFTVNGNSGSDIELKEGDVFKSTDYTIEFLVVPHTVSEKFAQTQFLDVEEIAALNKDATRVTQVTRVSKNHVAAQAEVYAKQEAIQQKSPEPKASREVIAPTEAAVPTPEVELESPPSEASPSELVAKTSYLDNPYAPAAPEGWPESGHETKSERKEATTFSSKSSQPIPEGLTQVRRKLAEEHHSAPAPARSVAQDITGMLVRRPDARHERRGELVTFFTVAFLSSGVGFGVARIGNTLIGGVIGMALLAALPLLFQKTRNFTGVQGTYLEQFRFLSFASVFLVVWGFATRISWILGIAIGLVVGVGLLYFFFHRFKGDFKKFAAVGGWIAALPALITGADKYIHRADIGATSVEVAEVTAEGAPKTVVDSNTQRQPADVSVTSPVNAPVAQVPAVQQPQVAVQSTAPVQAPQITQNVEKPGVAQPAVAVAQVVQPEAPKKHKEDIPDPLATEEFFTACKQGNLSVVKSLVNKHAVDPSFTLDRGNTALMYAAQSGRMNVVKFLITKKVDLNAQDPNGTTALMWAAYRGHDDVVKYLIEKGADLRIRRDDGERAIDIARKWKRRKIVAFLESRSASVDRSVASKKKSAKKKRR